MCTNVVQLVFTPNVLLQAVTSVRCASPLSHGQRCYGTGHVQLTSLVACRYLRRKINTPITKHPDTPDVHQICSKRSFDGQAKKWRRELHLWDPEDEDDLIEPVMVCVNKPHVRHICAAMHA